MMLWLAEARQGVEAAGERKLSDRELAGAARFHEGLGLFVMGRLPEALEAFADARSDAPNHVPAAAWFRRSSTKMA